jgi:predicted TPR repeat methyltransferase
MMASLTILKNTDDAPPPWELQKLYQTAQFYFNKQNWALSSLLLYYINHHVPGFHQALFQLGVAQMSLNYWQGAQESFEKLRFTLAWDPDVICNLAIIYWKQKKLKKSLSFFKFNIKNHPLHLPSKINLASFYIEYQRFNQAIKLYNELVYLYPQNLEYRFNLAACLQKNRHFEAALFHYRHILQENKQHYDAIYNMACIYWQLKNISAARFYWQTAQNIRSSPHIQFILETLINKKTNLTHHQAYVVELFQQYAENYDHDLKNHLKYQIPDFLKDYLKNIRYGKVLEIGCGTGINGPIIKNICQYLIGVDLSFKMLEKALKKTCYDELRCYDALVFLEENSEHFDCLFALDVSPYILNFERIFVAPHIREMIFSIEISSHYPCELLSSGRMSYHPDFIRQEALKQGFKIHYQKQLVARMQNQLFIEVMLYHLKKG